MALRQPAPRPTPGHTVRRCAAAFVLTVGALALIALPAGAGASTGSQGADEAGGGGLAQAVRTREAAEARLAASGASLAAIDAELATTFAAAEELAADLVAARTDVRRAAVAAFVNGGSEDRLMDVLMGADTLEISARSSLIADRVLDAGEAVERFETLKQASDPKLVELAGRREQLADAVANADDALRQAKAHEADAERLEVQRLEAERVAAERAAALERVAAAERARAAQAAAASGGAATPKPASSSAAARPTPTTKATGGAAAPPVVTAGANSAPLPSLPPGGPSPEAWAALRRCESGGNYRAVSPSGKYRGAYQFDQRTWEGLGGRGDPAAAPPAEQDARAALLYSQRGARPWPVCGRGLDASLAAARPAA